MDSKPRRRTMKPANHWRARPLRARCERPGRRRATEQSDELASFHPHLFDQLVGAEHHGWRNCQLERLRSFWISGNQGWRRSVFLACILVAALVAPARASAGRRRRDTIARLHALDAVALSVLVGLDVLIRLNVLVSLDVLVRLNRPVGLNCLVVLGMRGVTRLEALSVLAALNALDSLRAFAELHRT